MERTEHTGLVSCKGTDKIAFRVGKHCSFHPLTHWWKWLGLLLGHGELLGLTQAYWHLDWSILKICWNPTLHTGKKNDKLKSPVEVPISPVEQTRECTKWVVLKKRRLSWVVASDMLLNSFCSPCSCQAAGFRHLCCFWCECTGPSISIKWGKAL